jgi:hypothetical protein
MSENDGNAGVAVLSVACPGGMARQFRVQVRDERTPGFWQLVGSFRQAGEAHAAVERLQNAGKPARVIECRALPTAA